LNKLKVIRISTILHSNSLRFFIITLPRMIITPSRLIITPHRMIITLFGITNTSIIIFIPYHLSPLWPLSIAILHSSLLSHSLFSFSLWTHHSSLLWAHHSSFLWTHHSSFLWIHHSSFLWIHHSSLLWTLPINSSLLWFDFINY